MKIALLSDIHANLHALQAVLADIEARGLTGRTWHLGDLVGYAPFPDEVVALLRDRGIQGIAGNYDSTVATHYDHCGCKYEDPIQAELSHRSYAWTLENTSEDTKRELGRLPFRMDLRAGGGHGSGRSAILVHGTPTLNTLYWHEDRSDAFCSKMAKAAGARTGDLIAFGHTHKPWFREVEGVFFLNTGSVGRPKDGDWRAGYVIVDLATEVPSVEFVRVEYDLESACAAIEESTLPSFFAEYLRTGGTARAAAEALDA